LLGREFVWIGSDGNLYLGATRWHPDNAEGYRRLKVAFYLDALTKGTCCLRVLPGAHIPELATRLKDRWPKEDPMESPYDVKGSQIYSPLESGSGDIVFFNQGLLHSSYGGKTGRRMFTLNFGAKPRAEADIHNLRRTYQANIKSSHEVGFTK
jgi:ectoine hydroxylase-related dioxygenase (phytanoyl-CoA dioxygenase family)